MSIHVYVENTINKNSHKYSILLTCLNMVKCAETETSDLTGYITGLVLLYSRQDFCTVKKVW